MHDQANVVWQLSSVGDSANVVDKGVFNGHERVYLPGKAPLPSPTSTEDLPHDASPTPTTKLSPYNRGPLLSLSMLQQQRRDAEQELRAITAVQVCTHWHTPPATGKYFTLQFATETNCTEMSQIVLKCLKLNSTPCVQYGSFRKMNVSSSPGWGKEHAVKYLPVAGGH